MTTLDQGLATAELSVLARTLGARERLWRRHVVARTDQRAFVELASGPSFSSWLVCWMDGHDTGWHDHDGCAGALLVLEGAVHEERLRIGDQHEPTRAHAGTVITFDADAIHRVRHADGAPAVTLHVYSPPLRRTGAYTIDPTGWLRRHALDEGAELRPLA